MARFSDIQTREVRRIASPRKITSELSFSTDGEWLALACDNPVVYLVDVERVNRKAGSYRAMKEYTGHSAPIQNIAWNKRSQNLFATGATDSNVNVYDVRGGNSPIKGFKISDGCLHLEWSPDGEALAASDRKDKFYHIDTRKWEVVQSINFETELNQFRWSHSGNRMFLAKSSGNLDIVSWPSMDSILQIKAHTQRCLAIACDHSDLRMAVTSNDESVSVWDVQTFSNIYTIDRFDKWVRLIEYSHDDQILALATKSNNVHLVDALSGASLWNLSISAPAVTLSWHPNRQLLAYATERPPSRNYIPSDAPPNINIWGFQREARG